MKISYQILQLRSVACYHKKDGITVSIILLFLHEISSQMIIAVSTNRQYSEFALKSLHAYRVVIYVSSSILQTYWVIG